MGIKEDIKVSPEDKTITPEMYKVVIFNDDYTTMDFVIMVLETVFNKDSSEATRIMLNVHNQGIGIAGVYTREIGETKINVVHDMAKKNQYPLKCSLEKVST